MLDFEAIKQSIYLFYVEHPQQSLIWVLLLVGALFMEYRFQRQKPYIVPILKAVQAMNHQGWTVIDLRSSEEYERGHILGAKLQTIEDSSDGLKPLAQKQKGTLLLVCDRGGVSGHHAERLSQLGHLTYAMQGGMQAWYNQGMPVEIKKG